METFNLNDSIGRAKKILRFHKISAYKIILLPLISHFGALISIGLAWFNRSGYFRFDINNWFDWIISITLIVLFLYGSYWIIENFVDKNSIVVTRQQASDLIALARSEADYSFTNISGDLSWLQEDYQQLLALRELRPYLKMRIYYDAGDVSLKDLKTMRELIDRGIEFTPYPHSVTAKMKCILIDREAVHNSKLFEITKKGIPQPLAQDKSLRLWHSYTDNSSLPFKGIISFLNILESAKPRPLLIGICGVNNIGKTQFAKKLYETLNTKYRADLVDDMFRQISNGRSVEGNYQILFSQLKSMRNNSADILIFDQTIIDTFCYLQLRAGDSNANIGTLGKEIAAAAKDFDLIIHLTKSNDDYKKSAIVTLKERRFIGEAIDDFFGKLHLAKLNVTLDVKQFDKSLQENVVQVAEKVAELYQQRSL